MSMKTSNFDGSTIKLSPLSKYRRNDSSYMPKFDTRQTNTRPRRLSDIVQWTFLYKFFVMLCVSFDEIFRFLIVIVDAERIATGAVLFHYKISNLLPSQISTMFTATSQRVNKCLAGFLHIDQYHIDADIIKHTCVCVERERERDANVNLMPKIFTHTQRERERETSRDACKVCRCSRSDETQDTAYEGAARTSSTNLGRRRKTVRSDDD
jgi:hypothetical protein